jgi:hypothetical protein
MNDNDLLGANPCPECGHPAMFAWDAGMNSVGLDPGPCPGGEWTLTVDPNHIHRCAPVPDGTQIAFDDELYSLHVCPLAEVIDLAARRPQPSPEDPRRRYA